jgi:hypothetical protein
VTAVIAAPLVEQSTHVASGGDSLERRIQRVMDEGLVMGGVPRERKLDISEKLSVNAEKRESGDKSMLERASKDRSMKKKKASRPSEKEGMDVKTKESAEKLVSDLVEIIKGLPAGTRPEDIFEGVRDRFRDATFREATETQQVQRRQLW